MSEGGCRNIWLMSTSAGSSSLLVALLIGLLERGLRSAGLVCADWVF